MQPTRVVLFICLLLGLFPISGMADEEGDARRKLGQVERAIKQLQSQIAKKQDERSSADRALRKIEVAIGGIRKELDSIQDQLVVDQQRLKDLEIEQQNLKDKQTKQRRLLSEHIAALYTMGRQSKLKLLLNQEQPERISRALTYYESLHSARMQLIEEYRATLSRLASIEPEIRAQHITLAQRQQRLEKEQSSLDQQKLARGQALAALNKELAQQGGQLKRMQQDRKALEELLDNLLEAINDIPIPDDYAAFKTRRGKLPLPIQGKLINRFGDARTDNGLTWQGVTIDTTEGAAVSAIHHGRVVFADWLRGYGLITIVDHGDGFLSLYAHNESLEREVGEWVKAGDTIARAGLSGGQKTSRLYFEIRANGVPQNPLKWCKR